MAKKMTSSTLLLSRRWHFAFLCHLFLLLVRDGASCSSDNESKSDTTTLTTTLTATTKHHLLLPRDVFFDPAARDALTVLRDDQTGGKENSASCVGRQELASAGDQDRLTLTMTGYKGGGRGQDQINQDRSFIMAPFLVPKDDADDDDNDDDDSLLMAVFDGHGSLGHDVAEFCTNQLPPRLLAALEAIVDVKNSSSINTTAVADALRAVVEEVDRDIPREMGREGGATATIVLRLRDHLYFANAGDSQSMLASYLYHHHDANDHHDQTRGVVRLWYATRLDKPDHPDERQRILEAGGRVSEATEDDDARVRFVHSNGQDYGLAMSRSLGDFGAIGVISTPIVHVISIPELLQRIVVDKKEGEEEEICTVEIQADGSTENTCSDGKRSNVESRHVQLFVVSASDGLIDYVEPEELVAELGWAFYGGVDSDSSSSSSTHPLTAAEKLIHTSAKRWHKDTNGRYRDDIVIAAAKIFQKDSYNDSTKV
jgi:serine/threonine protein phosphatase PrpC